LLTFVFHVVDISKKRGRMVQFVSFYGIVTLSMYIFHNLYMIPFLNRPILNIPLMFLYTAFIWISLFVLMRTWTMKTPWCLEGVIYILSKWKNIKLKNGKEFRLTIQEAFNFTPTKFNPDREKLEQTCPDDEED